MGNILNYVKEEWVKLSKISSANTESQKVIKNMSKKMSPVLSKICSCVKHRES